MGATGDSIRKHLKEYVDLNCDILNGVKNVNYFTDKTQQQSSVQQQLPLQNMIRIIPAVSLPVCSLQVYPEQTGSSAIFVRAVQTLKLHIFNYLNNQSMCDVCPLCT